MKNSKTKQDLIHLISELNEYTTTMVSWANTFGTDERTPFPEVVNEIECVERLTGGISHEAISLLAQYTRNSPKIIEGAIRAMALIFSEAVDENARRHGEDVWAITNYFVAHTFSNRGWSSFNIENRFSEIDTSDNPVADFFADAMLWAFVAGALWQTRNEGRHE